jgi:hypothetical protein
MPMRLSVALAGSLLLALSGCVAPTGPVEVSRFVAPDVPLGRGSVAVEPAPGENADMEFRYYAAAVTRQLIAHGYSDTPGTTDQVALLRIERQIYRPERSRGPVSVGVGGGAGSYGSGLGFGVGIDLSGPPPEMVETGLFVTIKDRATGKSLWEGRAAFTVRADSPLADTHLGAQKMAEALFKDFPGRSGETILVK